MSPIIVQMEGRHKDDGPKYDDYKDDDVESEMESVVEEEVIDEDSYIEEEIIEEDVEEVEEIEEVEEVVEVEVVEDDEEEIIVEEDVVDEDVVEVEVEEDVVEVEVEEDEDEDVVEVEVEEEEDIVEAQERMSDASSSVFDDNSSAPAASLDSSAAAGGELGQDVQFEMQLAAESEGARKAREEELARERALAQERIAQDEAAEYKGDAELDELRRRREALQRQKEQDEAARLKLANEIKRVDMALAKKRETVAQSKQNAAGVDNRKKKALAELRRHAAREELARNNDRLKAARRRGGHNNYVSGSSSVGSDPDLGVRDRAMSDLKTFNVRGGQQQAPVSPTEDQTSKGASLVGRISSVPVTTTPYLNGNNKSKPGDKSEFPDESNDTATASAAPAPPVRKKLNVASIYNPTNAEKKSGREKPKSEGPRFPTRSRSTPISKLKVASIYNPASTAATEPVKTSAPKKLELPKPKTEESQQANSRLSIGPQSTRVNKLKVESIYNPVSTPATEPVKTSAQKKLGLAKPKSESQQANSRFPVRSQSTPMSKREPTMDTAQRESSAFKAKSEQEETKKPSPVTDKTADDGKFYSIDELRSRSIPGLDYANREVYLSTEEFQQHFKMSKEEFAQKPKWKRDQTKRKLGLF